MFPTDRVFLGRHSEKDCDMFGASYCAVHPSHDQKLQPSDVSCATTPFGALPSHPLVAQEACSRTPSTCFLGSVITEGQEERRRASYAKPGCPGQGARNNRLDSSRYPNVIMTPS